KISAASSYVDVDRFASTRASPPATGVHLGRFLTMRVGRFAKFQYSMIAAFVLMSTWPSRALAQDDHVHGVAAQHQEQTPEQKKQASALVQAVREATRPFLNVENAAPDYALVFGCVSGGDFGAMGMHFLNGSLLGDGEVD